MTTTFFTDPHLGLRRASHTTTASRERWYQRIYEQARIASPAKHKNICLGDLFDKYSNDERTILQGADIATRCHYVMAGNHDVVADNDKVGSLKLLSNLGKEICLADFGDFGFETTEPEPDLRLYMIPHVTDQGLFEQSMIAAVESAEEADGYRVLCLHCNYESPFIDGDTSLNLTRERAQSLLHTFNYILIGHEHTHREDFDGRLIVIGSTFPTAFDNMTDKIILHWRDGEFEKEVIWPASRHYTWEVGTPLAPPEYVEFITVTGTVTRDDLALASGSIAAIWKNHPQLLGLRSQLKVEGDDAEIEMTEADLQSLPITIAAELKQKDAAMAELFNELLAEENSHV